MPHDIVDDVQKVFGRDMDEVHAHCRRLAEQRLPEVERAIANLTGTGRAATVETAAGAAEAQAGERDADEEPDELPADAADEEPED